MAQVPKSQDIGVRTPNHPSFHILRGGTVPSPLDSVRSPAFPARGSRLATEAAGSPSVLIPHGVTPRPGDAVRMFCSSGRIQADRPARLLHITGSTIVLPLRSTAPQSWRSQRSSQRSCAL